MNRLAHITEAANVFILNNVQTATFPIYTYGLVPATWGNVQNGHPAEIDLNISSLGGFSLTDVKLYQASLLAYDLPGVTFTTTHATEIVNITTHGYFTGDGPFRLTTSGTLPAGFALATDYWIVRVTDNTFKLATSFANALAETTVSITSDGSGTHTITGNSSLLVSWCLRTTIGTLALASREGYVTRIDHDPRVFAYGIVFTGTATNLFTATMAPVLNK